MKFGPDRHPMVWLGHSPRGGVWIEIWAFLKLKKVMKSLPARGVWIEIRVIIGDNAAVSCHSPRGGCGLK